MYQSSVKFGELIQQDSRTFHAKITLGEHSITEGIKSIKLNGGSNSEDDFSIGSAVSQYVEITMAVPGFRVEGYEFQLEIGAVLEIGVDEYVPMGYFTAEKPDANEEQITITAYDRMMKTECPCFLELPDTTDTVAVLNAISTITGVTVVTTGLTAISMQKPVGYTCREVLSYIAQMYGGFAICNRQGQIEIRTYEDNGYTVPTRRYWNSFEHNDVAFLLEKLTCYTGKDSEGEDTSISVGSGVREVSFSNPFMTQAMLDNVWGSLQNYTYMPGRFKFLGDPRVDPWDILTVKDRNGTSYKVPAMKLTQEFDGGLSTTVEAVGRSEAEQSYGFEGPQTKQMDRYYAQLVVIDRALVNKIDADVVEANYVKSTRFEGLQADFESTKTRYLAFESATGNDLTLIHGNIQTLEGDYASFKSTVTNQLSATTADITNLTGRFATFEQTTTQELITAKGWMAEGSIGSAQISSVDANKIRSGTIDTAIITVAGTDGRLRIADNTIQISDANRVRVQVGKDASNDYTLAVWDSSGNLIWDALGATEKTIQRKIIRDKMVADDAAIQAMKLDLQSFNTAMTNQGVTISGTVVQVGNKTLNVALTEQTQLISEHGETLTDHATKIAANENAISLRVTTQVYDSYKSVVDGEIASAKSRLSTAESSITAMNGQIALKVEQTDIDTAVKKVDDKFVNYSTTSQMQSAINQKADSITLTVSQTYATKEENQSALSTANTAQATADKAQADADALKSRVTTCETRIDQNAEAITLRATKTELTNAVDGIQIGGRNLLLGTKDYSSEWVFNGTYPILDEDGFYYKSVYSTWSNYCKQSINLKIGSYMLSFDARASSSVPLEIKEDSLNNYILTTVTIDDANWKRYSVLINIKKDEYTPMITFLSRQSNTEIHIKKIKLESGNKLTDWSPAPEDQDAATQAVADNLANNYYNKIQTDAAIQVKADSITSTVSSTYATKSENQSTLSVANAAQSTANTANVKASNAQKAADDVATNLANNYSTTVQMNSAIEQKADSIISSVSATYQTKDAMGNYSTTTQMNSAISQSANNIKSEVSQTYATNAKVDGIQIGGRNLFLGTKDYSTGWYKNGSNFVLDEDGFYYKILIDHWNNYISQNVNLEIGSYTISFFARASSPVTLEIKDDSGNNYPLKYIIIDDAQWKLYTSTLQIVKNEYVPAINFLTRQTNTEIHIKKIKLEKGNKPTDWSPAPEDVDNSIGEVKTIAEQTADKFTWIVKSGTSATNFTLTDRTATLIAETISLNGNVKVNGDMLVSGSVTADKITTGSVTTDKLAANAVTAEKINVTDLFAQDITATGTIRGVNLVGASGSFSGTVTASGGTIGGFTINSKRLISTDSSSTNAAYVASYDYNNTTAFVTQTKVSGSWVNTAEIRYDGSIISRNKDNTALSTTIASGSIKCAGNDGWSASTTVELSNGMIKMYRNSSSIEATIGFNENGLNSSSATARVTQINASNSGLLLSCQGSPGLYVYKASMLSFVNLNMNGHSVINSSDERLKKNIIPVTRSVLADINGLDIVSYDWIDSEKHVTAGFTAQNMQTRFPELVEADERGILGIKTIEFVPYLAKGIQELDAKSKDLDTRINSLDSKYQSETVNLKARVSSLEYQLQQAFMRIAEQAKQIENLQAAG